MEDPFLGEIEIFAGNFAPFGWKICNGAILSITEYDALYSLIGTVYGGDGVTTFGIPDLRGRVPIHFGTGKDVNNITRTFILGQTGGTEKVTLTREQIPEHSHEINGGISYTTRGDAAGNLASPDNHSIAQAPLKKFFGRAETTDKMAPIQGPNTVIGSSGGNIPHNNMQPSLVLNYIIAVVGIYPSRN